MRENPFLANRILCKWFTCCLAIELLFLAIAHVHLQQHQEKIDFVSIHYHTQASISIIWISAHDRRTFGEVFFVVCMAWLFSRLFSLGLFFHNSCSIYPYLLRECNICNRNNDIETFIESSTIWNCQSRSGRKPQLICLHTHCTAIQIKIG